MQELLVAVLWIIGALIGVISPLHSRPVVSGELQQGGKDNDKGQQATEELPFF
jgi:hypothetical protein